MATSLSKKAELYELKNTTNISVHFIHMPWRLRHFLLTVEAECLYHKLFLMALNDKCQKTSDPRGKSILAEF